MGVGNVHVMILPIPTKSAQLGLPFLSTASFGCGVHQDHRGGLKHTACLGKLSPILGVAWCTEARQWPCGPSKVLGACRKAVLPRARSAASRMSNSGKLSVTLHFGVWAWGLSYIWVPSDAHSIL